MRLAILAVALALAPLTARADCEAGIAEIRGDFGQVAFQVELADSVDERAQGLMNRSSMAEDAGMLFLYERPQDVYFWMENTLIPLDMIFLDARGRVVRVHENAVPLDRTPIPGGSGVLAVLEINGGLARRLGIEAGDELRHQAMPQSGALWSCAD